MNTEKTDCLNLGFFSTTAYGFEHFIASGTFVNDLYANYSTWVSLFADEHNPNIQKKRMGHPNHARKNHKELTTKYYKVKGRQSAKLR